MKKIKITPQEFTGYEEYAKEHDMQVEEATHVCNEMIVTVYLAGLYEQGYWPEDVLEANRGNGAPTEVLVANGQATAHAKWFAREVLGLGTGFVFDEVWIELEESENA